MLFFFFSSSRRNTRLQGDWSSDVCSSDLLARVTDGRWRVEPLAFPDLATLSIDAFCYDAAWLGEEGETFVAWSEKIGRASGRERVEMGGGSACMTCKWCETRRTWRCGLY